MFKTSAALCLLAALLATPHAHAAKPLSIDFTISNANGFNGVDTSSLTLKHGKLAGTVNVISPGPATYPCAVNPGSTDKNGTLRLTCAISADEMVTLTGTLKPHSGHGHGTFSETFFKSQGTYKAAPANLNANTQGAGR